MSDELMPLPQIDQLVARYRGMKEEDWKKAFTRAMTMQAHGLLEMAALIRAKEEDGVNMDEIREGIEQTYDIARKFAYGTYRQSLARFWPDDLGLIRLVGRLAPPDQDRVANDERFAVIVLQPNGEFTRFMRTAARMTPDERRLVFGSGTIRNEQEQKDILTDKRTRQLRQKAPEKCGLLKMDYDRNGFIVGNQFVPLATAEEAVRALKRFGHRQTI